MRSWVGLCFSEAWDFAHGPPEGFDFVMGVVLVDTLISMAGEFLADVGMNAGIGEGGNKRVAKGVECFLQAVSPRLAFGG